MLQQTSQCSKRCPDTSVYKVLYVLLCLLRAYSDADQRDGTHLHRHLQGKSSACIMIKISIALLIGAEVALSVDMLRTYTAAQAHNACCLCLSVLQFIAAVFLPPLGVFLEVGCTKGATCPTTMRTTRPP